MKLLVDAQLPPALARFLAALGCEAAHVEDIGLRFAEDGDIWQWAADERCAIVTKDEDFYRRWLAGQRAVPVVWLRCGNVRNRALFAKLEPILPDLLSRLERGETMIEVVWH